MDNSENKKDDSKNYFFRPGLYFYPDKDNFTYIEDSFPLRYSLLLKYLDIILRKEEVDYVKFHRTLFTSVSTLKIDLKKGLYNKIELHINNKMISVLSPKCLEVYYLIKDKELIVPDELRNDIFKFLNHFIRCLRFYKIVYEYILTKCNKIYISEEDIPRYLLPEFEFDYEYIKEFVNEILKGRNKIDYLTFIINEANIFGIDEKEIDKFVKFKKFIVEEVLPAEEAKTSDDKSNENDGTFSLDRICQYNPNSKKINWLGNLEDIVRFARLIEIKKYNKISSRKELGNFVIKHFEWKNEELDFEKIKKQIGKYYTKNKNEIVFKSKLIKGHEEYILNELLDFLG
jgi:hypothetical protein